MNPDDILDSRLAALRAELQSAAAPDALEPALVAAFRRAHGGGAARPRLWWLPPLALAATVVTVSWMIAAPLAPQPRPAAAPVDADAGPFLALRPLERIALEPGTTVVATEFPRALLADWGLPVAPDRAGEPVRAEMLYSADGEALAVRLIR
ncbi:MAG TPA: hypothetical protein VLC53_16700 [Myxococcota bacterium]|nr:hypothetical protein [Myxococcota bacterium]